MSCQKCGCEIPGNSKFCLDCGRPVVARRPAAADVGTIIFGGFSLLSLAVFLVQGLVPIYFIEAVAWALAAWLWHKRKPTSQVATAAVLLLAVAVAAGEGYLLGARSAVRYNSTQLGASLPPGVVDSPSPATELPPEAVTKAEPQRSTLPRITNGKTAAPQNPREPLPPSTCSRLLLPGENRTPVALGSAVLALVRTSLASTNTDSLSLDVENGSSYCVTSIAVSIIVESDWAKTDKTLNQILSFSPAISPGQKQNQNVSNEISLNGGGSERVTGLVKRWNITEVRGFPAPSNKSQ
jgi:hypothetical protein